MDPEAREALVRLLETLARLNPADRNIYWLRQIVGLEHAEIGAAIGRSISTVRRRFERLTKRVTSLMRADPLLSAYLARGRTSETPRRRRQETATPGTDPGALPPPAAGTTAPGAALPGSGRS